MYIVWHIICTIYDICAQLYIIIIYYIINTQFVLYMLYAIYICVYMHTYASIYMISLYIIDKYIISLGMSILRGQWN